MKAPTQSSDNATASTKSTLTMSSKSWRSQHTRVREVLRCLSPSFLSLFASLRSLLLPPFPLSSSHLIVIFLQVLDHFLERLVVDELLRLPRRYPWIQTTLASSYPWYQTTLTSVRNLTIAQCTTSVSGI